MQPSNITCLKPCPAIQALTSKGLTLVKPKQKKAEGSPASKAAPSNKQQEGQVAKQGGKKPRKKPDSGVTKHNTKSKRKIKAKTDASKASGKAGSKAASKAGSKAASKAASKTGKYKIVKWSVCRVCNRAPKDR